MKQANSSLKDEKKSTIKYKRYGATKYSLSKVEIEEMISSWNHNRRVPTHNLLDYNPLINDLREFFNICLDIKNDVTSDRNYPYYSTNSAHQDEIIRMLDKVDENSFYYEDALFLKALFEQDKNRANEYLTLIKEDYGVAQYLIDNNEDVFYIDLDVLRYYRLLSKISKGNTRTDIGDKRRASLVTNATNLLQFILNIDKFRSYVEPRK